MRFITAVQAGGGVMGRGVVDLFRATFVKCDSPFLRVSLQEAGRRGSLGTRLHQLGCMLRLHADCM